MTPWHCPSTPRPCNHMSHNLTSPKRVCVLQAVGQAVSQAGPGVLYLQLRRGDAAEVEDGIKTLLQVGTHSSLCS